MLEVSRFTLSIIAHKNKEVKDGLVVTRKYPLRRYILGVLTHTTAWDQNWGGDETLKLVLVYVA